MKFKLLTCCVLSLFVLPVFVSVLISAEPVGTSKSFRGPVGLVVYSLRNQIKESGVVALDFAKEQGFVEVEIGLDNHYGLTQEQMKEALKQRGLKPIGAHAGYDFLLKQTDKAVEIANDLGVKYVGVAWAPHKKPLDEAQTLKIAEDFNTIGKRLKEKGIQFYYHNHGYEFYPYKNGETLFDLLVQKTDADCVKFEMDVMWTIFPGQDPVQLLKKYPDRWILMHLKDLAKGVEGNLSGGTDTKNDVALGTGQVDYPAVLKAAQEIGVKHYFIEDESSDVLKQIPQSLKYLSGIEF
ncbi:MAG: sugar phosphate isomerase/epimerase [Planctomycetaceae bacterium]|jgi:sugar phosphate isomerase/epimerase|nr:sugar phosphate isomerase/epimerase [Planctomycetaceae bacterium]